MSTNDYALQILDELLNDIEESNSLELVDFEEEKELPEVIVATIVYAVIYFIGVIGNVMICLVIGRNKSMHTTTNCYLFNLAISDLLLLFSGIPFEIYDFDPYENFGFASCFFKYWPSETSATVSILTVTAFTMERYLAICHPFVASNMFQQSRAIKIIVVIWLIGASCGTTVVHYTTRSPYCFLADEGDIILLFDFAVFFVLPLVIIVVLYTLIGVKLIKSRRMFSDQSTRSIDIPTKKILRMLVLIALVFCVCWTPYRVERTFYILDTRLFIKMAYLKKYDTIRSAMEYGSKISYCMSAVLNPIIYSLMSNKFKQAIKETLAKCCHVSWFANGQRPDSHSSANGKTVTSAV